MYPDQYIPTCNTGLQSGLDLNDDGFTGGPDDAFGFGEYPGQYCMAILSKYPIDTANVRTFQDFRWQDMPDNVIPPGFCTTEVEAALRVSSKNHVDLPIDVDGNTFHLLAQHPTPPGFDGPEDANGRRNHDEIRLWADYLSDMSYLVDDAGNSGGLAQGEALVLVGDHNADPADGSSFDNAIQQLLTHPRVNGAFEPESDGSEEAHNTQGGANTSHVGNPRADTADFGDGGAGNLRVDYAQPSANLTVVGGAVYWPPTTDPAAPLVAASDHRLVYVDLQF